MNENKNKLDSFIGKILVNQATTGTGFIINHEGLVCTCAHVLEGKISNIYFMPETSQDKFSATIEAINNELDIVILRIPKLVTEFDIDELTLPYLISGLESSPGSWFHLSGYGKSPNLAKYNYFSATGNLLGKIKSNDGRELLQLETTAVLHGMSGSPLVIPSVFGVFGILSERFSKDTELTGQSIAIPIDYLTKLGIGIKIKSWIPDQDQNFLQNTLSAAAIDTLEIAIDLQSNESLKEKFNEVKKDLRAYSLRSSQKNIPLHLNNELEKLSLACFDDVNFKNLNEVSSLMELVALTGIDFERELTDKFTHDLISIPADKFLMGGSDFADATPTSTVDLREYDYYKESLDTQKQSFLISKYPVTNYQWWLFTKDTGWVTPPYWRGTKPPPEIYKRPVTMVSWGEAISFCSWLWTKTPYKWRLPTEAEWEFAARGKDGRKYSWGNNFDSAKCNTSESGIGYITDVDYYCPQGDSPFGVADMCGNIWEWTSSLFEKYPYNDQTTHLRLPPLTRLFFKQKWWNPDKVHVVMRGGSFGLNKNYATTYARIWSSAGNRGMYGGFRLALTGYKEKGEGGEWDNFQFNPLAELSFLPAGGTEIPWWTTQEVIGSSCGGHDVLTKKRLVKP